MGVIDIKCSKIKFNFIFNFLKLLECLKWSN